MQNSQATKLPNFLVIGNKRCGTSWVNRNLSDHPEIFMPSKKGVHFFDKDYDKGVDFYSGYFKDATTEKRIGETEHSYFWDDRVPERIHAALGIIPMILTVRQPVERAYSHFQLIRRFNNNRKEVPYNFEEAFTKAFEQNSSEAVWGFYGRQLKKFLKYFPVDKFCFIKFEDICCNPENTIRKVYDFLGVDTSFVSEYIHQKWTPATNLPQSAGHITGKIFYTSGPATFVRKVLRHVGFKNLRIYRPFSPPPLEIGLKKKLTAEYFDNDIKLLIDITGIDFSSWLSTSM